MNILDDFTGDPNPHWIQVATGSGYIKTSQSVLRLGYKGSTPKMYTDAQIDDYTMRSKKEYVWKPPLRMTVKARASHPAATKSNKLEGVLQGTAGFGFWNKPFTMQGDWFTMPESIWFFYASPSSNMALNPNTPGWGWKAQVVHGHKASSIIQAPPLAAAIAYGRVGGSTKPAAKLLQRFSGNAEQVIEQDLTEWHVYTLEWLSNKAVFYVDDEEVFSAPFAPTRPLGFVAWLDNAYAVATPEGEIKFGRTSSGEQWLDIDSVKIENI